MLKRSFHLAVLALVVAPLTVSAQSRITINDGDDSETATRSADEVTVQPDGSVRVNDGRDTVEVDRDSALSILRGIQRRRGSSEGAERFRVRRGGVEKEVTIGGPNGITVEKNVGGVRKQVRIGGGGGITLDKSIDDGENVGVQKHISIGGQGNGITLDKNVGGVEKRVQIGGPGGGIRLQKEGKEVAIGNWREIDVEKYDTDDVMEELHVEKRGNSLAVELPSDVLFDFNSADIKPEAADTLGKVAYLLRKKADGAVEVVGHTDSVGSDDFNQKLSEARALSVMRWLNKSEKIPADMMEGRGLGESKPVAHNTNPDGSDSPEGRAKNRRVEFLFKNS